MPLTEKQKEAAGAAVALTLLLVGAIAWWVFYIHPRDEFLGEVMACMEDSSKAEYQRCVEFVRAEVSDSTPTVRPQ